MARRTIIEDSDRKLGEFPDLLVDGEGRLSQLQIQRLTDHIRQLTRKVNTGISLGGTADGSRAGNLDAQHVIVNTGTAGTDQTAVPVPHNLGRVPSGFDLVLIEDEGQIWGKNVASWTSSLFYVGTKTDNLTVTLRVF